MKVWKLSVDYSAGWLAVSDPRDFQDDLLFMMPGEIYRIECVEMDKEEYENLNEFEGF